MEIWHTETKIRCYWSWLKTSLWSSTLQRGLEAISGQVEDACALWHVGWNPQVWPIRLWSVQGKVASRWPRVSALTFLDLKLQTSIITNSSSCHGVSRREYIFAEECLWTIIFYPSCMAMMPITKTGINACTTGHRDGQELNMGVRRTP